MAFRLTMAWDQRQENGIYLKRSEHNANNPDIMLKLSTNRASRIDGRGEKKSEQPRYKAPIRIVVGFQPKCVKRNATRAVMIRERLVYMLLLLPSATRGN